MEKWFAFLFSDSSKDHFTFTLQVNGIPTRLYSLCYTFKLQQRNIMLFLDVCASLHLSLGTVICGITNKWDLLLEGRICAFLRGEKEFGRLLSSQWIKVLFPLQWLITTTENEREKEYERKSVREGEWEGRQK